jgi:hypothetical protein
MYVAMTAACFLNHWNNDFKTYELSTELNFIIINFTSLDRII